MNYAALRESAPIPTPQAVVAEGDNMRLTVICNGRQQQSSGEEQSWIYAPGLWVRSEGGVMTVSTTEPYRDDGWSQSPATKTPKERRFEMIIGGSEPSLDRVEADGVNVGLSLEGIALNGLRVSCTNRESRLRTLSLHDLTVGRMALHLDGGTFDLRNVVTPKGQGLVLEHGSRAQPRVGCNGFDISLREECDDACIDRFNDFWHQNRGAVPLEES